MINDYYAFLNLSNVVVEVILGPLQAGSDINWEEYYTQHRGMTCKRTSIDGSFRKNYAGIGYSYDATIDAFIPPIPGSVEYWVLDPATAQWKNTPAGAEYYVSLAVKSHLKFVMNERKYDDIDSMPKYLPSTNPKWAAEAAAAISWCTAVWEKVEEIQDQVLAGQRPLPSPSEVIAELPVIQWPPA